MSVNFDNITKGTLDGNGWFDRYLRATRVQLNEAVKNNEITQEIYGQVLSAGIAPMMQQATEFELKRESADAEIALKYAALEIQQAELEIAKADLALREQELDLKERDQDDKELTSAKKRDLLTEQINESIQNVLSAARKVDSWDDNMLLKLTEMQSNVASFFINSNEDADATSIIMQNFTEMMQGVSTRANLKHGSQPAIP